VYPRERTARPRRVRGRPVGRPDRGALQLANRLVGNAEDAAGVEVVLGGLAVRASGPVTVALAGAPAAADIDGTAVAHHALVDLRRGQVLRLGAPTTGLRTSQLAGAENRVTAFDRRLRRQPTSRLRSAARAARGAARALRPIGDVPTNRCERDLAPGVAGQRRRHRG
jgi:hypothetical protein